MPEAAKTVEVQLLGRTYRVACEDHERESLMQATECCSETRDARIAM